MKQNLRVVQVLWHEPMSKQSSVEFEGGLGERVVAFSDGFQFESGENVELLPFGGLEYPDSFEAIFSGNPEHLMKMERVAEWDYRCYGIIVEIERRDVIVDCGGILVVVPELTSDVSSLGQAIFFNVERLEVR